MQLWGRGSTKAGESQPMGRARDEPGEWCPALAREVVGGRRVQPARVPVSESARVAHRKTAALERARGHRQTSVRPKANRQRSGPAHHGQGAQLPAKQHWISSLLPHRVGRYVLPRLVHRLVSMQVPPAAAHGSSCCHELHSAGRRGSSSRSPRARAPSTPPASRTMMLDGSALVGPDPCSSPADRTTPGTT